MRRKSRVKLIWGGNDAHRIIGTTLRYLPQMSHHKFSPHQRGVGTPFVSQHKAQTWTSGPISWHLWLRTNVKVESFPTDSLNIFSWGFHELQFGDTFYPRYKGWHFGINTRWILDSAAIAPGGHPIHNPAGSRPLTHEGSSAVSLAAVHTSVFTEISSTEHPSCKPTLIAFFTKPLGK